MNFNLHLLFLKIYKLITCDIRCCGFSPLFVSQVQRMPRFVIFDKTENEDRIFILYRCPTDLIRKLQNQAIMQAVLAKKI